MQDEQEFYPGVAASPNVAAEELASSPARRTERRAPFSAGARFVSQHRLLLILMVSYAIANVDRQILVILQEPIKRDLGLSDSQLGLLTGFSFSLFYAVLGIPMGRLADRCNRRDLIVVAMLAWSVLTGLVATVRTFGQLLILRIGVAIGESGLSPSSASIITDLYPPRHRATAMSFYTSGSQFGVLIGFIAGSQLEQLFGWRLAFVLAAIPGIVLAIILRYCVKEPPRTAKISKPISLIAGLKDLARYNTMRRLAFAVPMGSAVLFASLIWTGSFLVRSHGIPLVDVGTYLALVFGLGGMIGVWGTGFLLDALSTRDVRWQLWIPAFNLAATGISLALALTANSGTAAMLLLLIPLTFSSSVFGVGISITNTIAAPQFRATATAVYFLVSNVFGMGAVTWLVGIVSDLLQPAHGHLSLQYALLMILPCAAILSAFGYFIAASTLPDDLRTARSKHAARP